MSDRENELACETYLNTTTMWPLLETGLADSRYTVKLSSLQRISCLPEEPVGDEGERAEAEAAETMPHMGQPGLCAKAMMEEEERGWCQRASARAKYNEWVFLDDSGSGLGSLGAKETARGDDGTERAKRTATGGVRREQPRACTAPRPPNSRPPPASRCA